MYFAGCLDIPRSESGKTVVCAGGDSRQIPVCGRFLCCLVLTQACL